MEREEEERLIRRVRSGSAEAFAPLVEAYGPAVYALVRRIVRRPEEAEEVAQDVFLKAYRHLGRFDGRSRFSTWLYRIAWNTAISAVRPRRPFGSLFDGRLHEQLPDTADEEAEAAELTKRQLDALARAIDRLDPEERALVRLRYDEEQPVAACAAIFGITETNVKVRLHRIRKKLQQWIDEP